MAKTQEELTQLKNEYETLNNKLKKLTDDELKQVTGARIQRDEERRIETECPKIQFIPRPIK